MTIEQSDIDCPDCSATLEVIYVTELKQVVSAWACPDCGFVASRKHGFKTSVPLPEEKEYLVRVERPLSDDDVEDPLGDVASEFRARASAEIDGDELWVLIDPDDNSIIDVVGDENVPGQG